MQEPLSDYTCMFYHFIKEILQVRGSRTSEHTLAEVAVNGLWRLEFE